MTSGSSVIRLEWCFVVILWLDSKYPMISPSATGAIHWSLFSPQCCWGRVSGFVAPFFLIGGWVSSSGLAGVLAAASVSASFLGLASSVSTA